MLASLDRRFEDVVIFAVVVAELKLRDVEALAHAAILYFAYLRARYRL